MYDIIYSSIYSYCSIIYKPNEALNYSYEQAQQVHLIIKKHLFEAKQTVRDIVKLIPQP